MMNLSPESVLKVVQIYGVRILVALIIFFIGRWIAGLVKSLIIKSADQKKMDPTVSRFLATIAYAILLVFVVLAALAHLKIQTASLIAVFAAAGFAIGLALQGGLANFAAGVLIIMFRPFKKGDFVEAGGTTGSIDQVEIFNTIMTTPDNKKIIVPNSNIMGNNITNYSAHEQRRLDLVVGVSYGDELDKVKSVLQDILANEDRLLTEPTPTIGVSELADSSVNLAVRPWVKTGDYWPVRFDLIETIKKRFDQEGISIPFPQQDVHIIQS